MGEYSLLRAGNPFHRGKFTPARPVLSRKWGVSTFRSVHPPESNRRRRNTFSRRTSMSKVIVNLSLTLDGVIQAPGRPDEAPRGGFEHGGWALPYFDPVMGSAMGEGMVRMPALLFGRRTYEDFYAVWPNRTDGNPFTEVLNNA